MASDLLAPRVVAVCSEALATGVDVGLVVEPPRKRQATSVAATAVEQSPGETQNIDTEPVLEPARKRQAFSQRNVQDQPTSVTSTTDESRAATVTQPNVQDLTTSVTTTSDESRVAAAPHAGPSHQDHHQHLLQLFRYRQKDCVPYSQTAYLPLRLNQRKLLYRSI